MKYEITKNKQFNSVEIKFNGKPSEAIRNGLKQLKFRWHNLKQIWYGYADENVVKTLLNGTTEELPPKTEKTVKTEINGLKVGDMLVASWGYEQTNITTFQVISLCGKTSVRIREVNPIVKEEKTLGYMAADLTLAKPDRILPPVKRSFFITDQDKGDLKRVREDGSITINSYMTAFPLQDGEKFYTSWYY